MKIAWPIRVLGGICSAILAFLWIVCCLLLLPFWIVVGVWIHYVYFPVCFTVYLRGDVESVWGRCLPLWILQGSIDDLRDKAVPTYQPSFATQLARRFAYRFRNDHEFLARRVSASKQEAECAIEMLVWACEPLGEIPEYLLRRKTLIPARDVPPGHSSMTLGEFMSRLARDMNEMRRAKEDAKRAIVSST
jgi:hypothetical protein